MSIPRFSVNNHIFANLVMVLILVGGGYYAVKLPRSFFPEIEPSLVTLTVIYPGSTPVEIEKSVVIKIEEAIHDNTGVEKITSNVFESAASIVVKFYPGVDIDQAVNDIKAEVDNLQDLPDDLEKIDIRKVEFTLPVISVAVFGDTTERNLKAIAEGLRDELLDEGEITRAAIRGVREREVSINVEPALLEKYDLTLEQVARQIGSHNLDISGGELKASAGSIQLRTLGEEKDLYRLEEIVIRENPDGQRVQVRDVATVVDGFKETVLRGRFNGKPAVNITISKTRDQDAIEIAKVVMDFVRRKQKEFSAEVHIATRDNLARFIEGRLGLLARNAKWGLILVFLSLAVFLNFRVAFWTAAGVPVAVLGTFFVMRGIGYTTNLVTLFGMIVIMGMVVDDAIILGENIFRRFQEGMPAREAAIRGAEEVARPVMATILTTIMAFIPLTFIAGDTGKMFRPIAGVMIIALMVSMVEAFLVLPAHMAGTLSRLEKKQQAALANGAANPGKSQSFADKKEEIIEKWLRRPYARLLALTIDWRYVSITVAFTILVLSVVLVLNDRPPRVLMQKLDSDTLAANISMAAGTPAEQTLEAIKVVEDACLALSETRSVFSLVGQQISFNAYDGSLGGNNADPDTIGQVIIELNEAENRQRHSDEILAELRRSVRIIPGLASLKFVNMDGGPTGADFEINVRGHDLATLRRAVQYTRSILGEYKGVVDIRDNMNAGKMEARIALNPMGRIMGATVRDLGLQMRSAVFGAEAQVLQLGRDDVEVRVRLAKDARDGIGDIERLRIATAPGGRVPFGEMADLEIGRGFASLGRINRKRAVTIEAERDETKTDVPAHKIATALQIRLDDIGRLFPGVTVKIGGEKEEMSKSFGSLRIGFLCALLLIYAILALVFQSYIQPLIIMLAIPFGLVGAVFGHLAMGYPMTLLSFIGLLALSGIVVNDSLILVDFINRKRRDGMAIREAIIVAGRMRLRPIILTTVTTALGLLPLMAEQSLQAQVLIPMAISISFGLIFATVLTLLILPCFYFILDDIIGLVKSVSFTIWTGKKTNESP